MKILSVYFAGVLLATAAHAESSSATAPTPISALPFTITTSGAYYVTTNLTGTGGIMVSAPDVAIDLRGYTLTGENATNSGIFAMYMVTNLEVSNGTLRGWNGHGIYAETVNGSQVQDLEVCSNVFAGMDLGDGCHITHCKVHDNGTAGVTTGEKAVIKDTVAQANLSDGFRTGNDSQILHCSSLDNFGGGFVVGGRTVVKNCAATRNTQSGIFVNHPGCEIVGNKCDSNNAAAFLSGAGIYIFDSSNHIEANHLADNGNAGISVATGYTNNVIIKNTVTGSGKNNYLVPPGNEVVPMVAENSPKNNSANAPD